MTDNAKNEIGAICELVRDKCYRQVVQRCTVALAGFQVQSGSGSMTFTKDEFTTEDLKMLKTIQLLAFNLAAVNKALGYMD